MLYIAKVNKDFKRAFVFYSSNASLMSQLLLAYKNELIEVETIDTLFYPECQNHIYVRNNTSYKRDITKQLSENVGV